MEQWRAEENDWDQCGSNSSRSKDVVAKEGVEPKEASGFRLLARISQLLQLTGEVLKTKKNAF
jgi:hypothetical protein